MYLCLCYGVTDRKVKELVAQGVLSLREVQKVCQAGTDCGSCVCEIKELLLRERQRVDSPATREKEI